MLLLLQLTKLKIVEPTAVAVPVTDPEPTSQEADSKGSPEAAVAAQSSGGPAIAPADNAATQEARRSHETATTGKFVPTTEWLNSWKSKLQLGTSLRLIDVS